MIATASAASSRKTKASTKTANRRQLPARLRTESKSHRPRRGHARLAHQELVAKKNLDNIVNQQSYGLGVKELWDVQPGKIQPVMSRTRSAIPFRVACTAADGFTVFRTIAFPSVSSLRSNTQTRASIRTLHFKNGKQIPSSQISSEGGKLVRYGAKSALTAAVRHASQLLRRRPIIGDAGSFLDSQKLKGIHLAIKSECLPPKPPSNAQTGDTSAKTLSAFQSKIENSYIKKRTVESPQLPSGLRARPICRLSSTPRFSKLLADAASSIPCAHTPATKPTRKSTASSPSRVSRETANSLSTALPTSIIPARATKKISLAICTSRI